MKIAFWKMHGAGNDFILVDDRQAQFPSSDPDWIRHLCARHTGIGSEGIILIRTSETADFQMRFFNPDGNEAEMCGNGARCVARLAYDLGIAQTHMTIETAAGMLQAEIVAAQVRLFMTSPSSCRLHQTLDLRGQSLVYHFINTGVPHVVMETEALDKVDLQKLGADIRYHQVFAPRGTNVNVMTVTGAQSLRVRTYERGVEAETPACGTGIVACALVAGRLGKVVPPVCVTCAHGDVLEVNYRLTADRAEQVTLLGPTAYIFKGTVEFRPQ